ncbi:MAG: hypothetical protein ACOYEP_01885 [Limnochordia bacterium]
MVIEKENIGAYMRAVQWSGIVTPVGERITKSWKRLSLLRGFDGYT